MRECARSFLDFYAGNKSDERMIFVAASVPDKDHPGASLYLYGGGILLNRSFKPPSKPAAPSVCGRSHNSVNLNLHATDSNAGGTVEYRVEYRTSPQEDWSTLNTLGKSNPCDIPGLSPYKEYQFQYRAVSKPWVSLVSDTVSVTTLPSGAPGKPTMAQTETFDVKVAWEKPTVVGEGVTIHCYKIQYQESRETSSAECDRWLEIRTKDSKCLYIIHGLKPSASYTLRVSAVCGQAGESVPSHEASITMKNKVKSLFRSYLTKNNLLTDGFPKIYLLPVEKMTQENQGNFVKYRCGNESHTHGVKSIMVLGATGSGKTTLINAMANYVLGVEWEDDFRFKLINEETNRSQAESQTSSVTAYELSHREGFSIPYSLNIIDTPGFGDTRGIARDRTIIDDIRIFFTSPHGVDQIDAVCFVAQASLARLTTTQKYIFDSILSLFGKDIAENIRVLVTFADGQLPPVLEAINHSEIPCAKGEEGQPLHFKFNNSAIFAKTGTSGERHRDEDNFDKMFWKMGSSSMHKFFKALGVMPTKSLCLTKEVLQERRELDIIVQGLQLQINVGLMKLDEIRQIQQMLQQFEAEISANQNFEYEVEEMQVNQIDISGTGIFVTNCSFCHFTCHSSCVYSDDKDKRKCASMDKGGNCKICPGKCIWNIHYNQKYRFEYVTKKITKTYEELKRKYLLASGEKVTQQVLFDNLQGEFLLIQDTVLEKVERLSTSLARLKEIALRPNPLSTPAYIDLLIEAEEQEAKPGFLQRIQSLNDVKKQAELLAKVTNKEELSAEETKTYETQRTLKGVFLNKCTRFYNWFSGLWSKGGEK